jgi:hypothetical protein
MTKTLIAFLAAGILFACNDSKTDEKPMVKDAATTATDGKPPPSEFADPKYMDWGKKMLKDFESGNMTSYVNYLADNVVYSWSAGDSLVGKQAVADYWAARHKDVIKSLKTSNDIWLPVKINQSQRGPDAPGVWLISWHQVNIEYKNGKTLQFWVHTDFHYDNNDKVDRVVQYYDRGPINAALGTK